MNGYTVKPTVEPNDKYEKAKQDCITALKSFYELKPEQRKRLVQEALGSQFGLQVINSFPHCFK